ncbi:MAG: hypothetical protein VX959_02675 [Candidatus Thermoplasmatota archaeon]|nr:hypothetical protein [Candidatus Thermoplasmatota archaeon]
MTERHAKNSTQYGWGRAAVLLSVIFLVQTVAPAAVSEDTFDEMTLCLPSPGLDGVCDNRFDADDATQDITSWVEGMFHFNMTSPTEIQFQASWAIREWDKSGMDLFTSNSMIAALSSDNINANDGLPADVLRSAFDENTDPNDVTSPTIQESLLGEIDGSISAFLANWGGSTSPVTTWEDRVFLPDDSGVVSAVDCTIDPASDSDGNAFEPPICISTNVNISLPISSTYGLNGVSESNLNTALEGLLVMGSEITTKFDVRVEPGHKGTYSIQPPSYATVTDATGWGVNQEVSEDGGAYSSGLWIVDNRDDPNGLSPSSQPADLDMTIGMRDKSTTSIVQVSPDDRSLDLRVSIDLSDESNAFVEVIAGIYQIQSSSLSSWGVPDLMPRDKATIPVITSDGIRMAYHTGLLDLDDLSKNIPISGIGQALTDSGGGSSVKMGDFQWIHVSSAPLDQGGLNYTHSSTQCERGVNYCMEGSVAMDDTYPVYMRSVSHTFPFSLADLLGGNLGDSGFLNSVSGDDLSKLLNSGLEFSTVLSDETMEDFVGSLLPNGISADLTMEIVLPTWASTPQGGDSIVLNYRASGDHSGVIDLTGSDSFFWNHAICRDTVPSACFDGGGDTVCPSTSKSCAYMDVDMDVGEVSFASLPLTKGVTVEFALSVDMVIHRIAVPDELFDSLNTDSTSMSLDVLPSDLLRALLDIGSRGDPLEVEFSLCDNGKSYCEQSMPISSSQTTGLPWYVNELEKDIKSLIEDTARELTEEDGNGVGDIDMSGFTIDIEFPHEMITDNDEVIGDERGIILSIDIPKVSMTAGITNSWVELIGILRGNGESPEFGLATEDVSMNTLTAPFIAPMVAAMDSLTGALSSSMVAPSPEGVRVNGASADLPTSKLANIGDDSLGLSFAGTYTITMPLGMELENLTSEEGRITSVINNDSKRQVIYYTINQGMGDDSVGFTLLLTPFWVVKQVQYYIIGLLAFMLWRVRRRMTRRKRKKRARALEALEEMASSPIGYIAPQPTVEVVQVTDNGIVIKRRLAAT